MLILLSALAWAGQVAHVEVDLPRVVRSAEIAVWVELATPQAQVPVAIPVLGEAGEDCGTYPYGAWPVRVREVVHATAPGRVRPGQSLLVFPANAPKLLALAAAACTEGTSKSPRFPRYAGIEPRPGRDAIVLLRWAPGIGWTEAVRGSWFRPGQADRIREAWPAAAPAGDAQSPWLDAALCRVDSDCSRGPSGCSLCPDCPADGLAPGTVDAHQRHGGVCEAWKAGNFDAANPPPCVPCAPAEPPPDLRCVAMRCVDGDEPAVRSPRP